MTIELWGGEIRGKNEFWGGEKGMWGVGREILPIAPCFPLFLFFEFLTFGPVLTLCPPIVI
jgi:hypothetical protein